jgi:uncharacterized protein YaaQ
MVERDPTKLLVAIVPDRAAGRIISALVERRYGATSVGSTGGFLRRGNTTVLTGVPADAADDAAALIQSTYQANRDASSDEGIVVFALDVEWRLRV